MSNPSSEIDRKLPHWAALLFLIVVVLGLYAQTSQYELLAYDDLVFVTENPYVQKGLSKETFWWAVHYRDAGYPLQHQGVKNLWHPLTWISWATDRMIGGPGEEAAPIAHMMNVLLHLGSSLLLYGLMALLGLKRSLALLVALLWSVHPLQVEPVAWISARKDTLSHFWLMAAVVSYILHFRKPRIYYLILLYLSFVLALMAKPSTVVLPGILMALDYTLLGRKFPSTILAAVQEQLRNKWLMIALALVAAGLTYYLQANGTHQFFMKQQSFVSRLMMIPAGVGAYLHRILVPWGLNTDYLYPARGGTWFYVYSAAGIAFLLGWIRWALVDKKWVMFGLAWAFCCFLPMSGLAYVGSSFTSDRYMYAALGGVLMALVGFFSGKKPRVIIMVGSIFLVGWVTLSSLRLPDWRSSEAIFKSGVKVNPKSKTSRLNLATLMTREENYKKALEHYFFVLKHHPKDYGVLHNIGAVYEQQGDVKKAREFYLQGHENYPGYPPTLFKLGESYSQSGDFSKSIFFFEKACAASNWQQPMHLLRYTETLLKSGRRQRAKQVSERLLQMKGLPVEIQTHAEKLYSFSK